VFRLLRLLISLAMLGAFVWFGMTVKLGDKTLFEHLSAIGQSKETKDLVEGTKEAAKPVWDHVEKKISHDGGVTEHHSAGDRRALRREVPKHVR
jgi:hypothetical protein